MFTSESGGKLKEICTHQQGVNADQTEDLLDYEAAVKEEGI